MRLPGSPQAKAELRAHLAAQLAALDEDLQTRQPEAASEERRQVPDAAADDVDGDAEEDQGLGEGQPAAGRPAGTLVLPNAAGGPSLLLKEPHWLW